VAPERALLFVSICIALMDDLSLSFAGINCHHLATKGWFISKALTSPSHNGPSVLMAGTTFPLHDSLPALGIVRHCFFVVCLLPPNGKLGRRHGLAGRHADRRKQYLKGRKCPLCRGFRGGNLQQKEGGPSQLEERRSLIR
jgi:hypothetical protein